MSTSSAPARVLGAIAACLMAATAAGAKDAVRQVPSPVAAPKAPDATVPEIAGSRTSERADISVTVDRAKIIRLPEKTQTVVIGNPAIADLSIQKNGVVVVTGKSYGVTNLIALDGTGNMLAESNVNVTAPSDAIVVVQRGTERQSYTCKPVCQPSVVLGDATTYFSATRDQVDQRNQFATTR